MPNISRKAELMPQSPIRKLVPFAEKAKSNGVKVYQLNIGQPDIASPKISLEHLKGYDENLIAYSHSAGNISYREKLVSYYQSNDINIEADDILITTGGSEALLFAMQVCLNPDDEVIIPEPFYANYNGFSISSGVKVVPISTKIDNGFALPEISDFEKVITDKTKAIVVCNPGNPTGYLYNEDELNRLKDLALKYDLFIFSDEVYREFCYDGNKHKSIMQLEGLEQNAILIDSVSKRYSMCGARVGALITKNKEVIDNALKFGQARLSPPSLGQWVAEAALDTPSQYFVDVINEYVERRDIMVEMLNKIEGVVCPKPKGAFYAIASLPVESAEDFCQWMLDEFSYENQTVMMAPAAGFYANKDLGKSQVRIAYVLNKEDLTNAMICLEKGLKKYLERKEEKAMLNNI